jgi:hypothetical protein
MLRYRDALNVPGLVLNSEKGASAHWLPSEPVGQTWLVRRMAATLPRQAGNSSAAVADGRRQPSNSRSRTPCIRSGSHRVVPPPAAFRGTADVTGDAVAARDADPSTDAEPLRAQFERLLILCSAGHSRPKPARQASPKRPVARTDHVRAPRLRSSRSWPAKLGHLESHDRSRDRRANGTFESTAAAGRRQFECRHPPRQSLTVLRDWSAPDEAIGPQLDRQTRCCRPRAG